MKRAYLIENGKVNEAVLVICGGVFVVAFLLMLILSFSKDVQNAVCAVVTLLVTIVFFYQFALFDADTFIEKWLEKNGLLGPKFPQKFPVDKKFVDDKNWNRFRAEHLAEWINGDAQTMREAFGEKPLWIAVDYLE